MTYILDCTLRDGGYYNNWDFSSELINIYLDAMASAGVDIVEVGLRSLNNTGYKGPCAFSSDAFIRSLKLPKDIQIGVMINASELVTAFSIPDTLEQMFPDKQENSPVDIVRIACHIHEFASALPAVTWLKQQGYQVGINLMQIAGCSESKVTELGALAEHYSPDVLYFADSMGGLKPEQIISITGSLRKSWSGELGVHAHDNMGLALQNTLAAADNGATWLDATVTGMGRGPGNARTEELIIELAERKKISTNLIPLMQLIKNHFKPLQIQHGWGSNPYYYLAGKYGIHPTYIQKMLNDSRYNEEDLLAVIDHLRFEGGKKFSPDTLDAAREFYRGQPQGKWQPKLSLAGRDVLIVGTGPGAKKHSAAISGFIRTHNPCVIALNTQNAIPHQLIDYRIACHPVRLLADCVSHTQLPQPLITPYSMLPSDVQSALGEKEILDFGLQVKSGQFKFSDNSCTLPTSLVTAYALAVATSGQANRILMAGFDGYVGDDPRNTEMDRLLNIYKANTEALDCISLTPSRYQLKQASVYGPFHGETL